MGEAEHRPTPPPDDGSLEIVCREFVELVTGHLEGTLPGSVERAVLAHLELCDPCVEYLDQMQRTSSLLRSWVPDTLSPATREELLQVFARMHPAGADDR
jgi:hypothetical protein